MMISATVLMAPMSQEPQHVPMASFIAGMLGIRPSLYIPRWLMMASAIAVMGVMSMVAKLSAQICVGRLARWLEIS
nr:hypothetical protein Iba_scaffold14787CG0020 [Ipomoea batatas]